MLTWPYVFIYFFAFHVDVNDSLQEMLNFVIHATFFSEALVADPFNIYAALHFFLVLSVKHVWFDKGSEYKVQQFGGRVCAPV